MIDVVRDLELEDWLEHERIEALRHAAQRIGLAEHTAAMIRDAYNAGDAAHARGDDDTAERLWYAAQLLADGMRVELLEGQAA